MSSEKACMKALGSLDYGTAVTIGSYLGELINELKQVKGAYEDRVSDIDSLEKALREIDIHIRSTSDPIPRIVETLKAMLPEYQEYL